MAARTLKKGGNGEQLAMRVSRTIFRMYQKDVMMTFSAAMVPMGRDGLMPQHPVLTTGCFGVCGGSLVTPAAH